MADLVTPIVSFPGLHFLRDLFYFLIESQVSYLSPCTEVALE